MIVFKKNQIILIQIIQLLLEMKSFSLSYGSTRVISKFSLTVLIFLVIIYVCSMFILTLVETKFFTEKILPEYPCSTSENLKLSPQNSVLILEKFALVETTLVFRINTEWAEGVVPEW